jgi:carbon-monoxide dehydrogenase medium subunit
VKPSPFDYIRPATLEEALDVLAQDAEESKVLAGGQSLVPMMNFRLARPERLIDINRLPGLTGLRADTDRLHIGALTRHLALQTTPLGGALGSLLRRSAMHVGHLPIRTRGTFGGSVAHCDAASEWCLVSALLDAEMTVRSAARGQRTIGASDFFQAIFTTALEADEILTSVSLPLLDSDYRTGIAEFARRAGDFGIVTTASAVRVTDGVVADARISIGGVSEVPFRARTAEALMLGQEWTPALVVAAGEATADEVDPPSDTHGDAAYRRDLVRALLPRALNSYDSRQGTGG